MHGRFVETPFSANDRLELMQQIIERYLDLGSLVNVAGGSFVTGYFAIDDPELRAMAMVPYEEYALRGDIIPDSNLIPIHSRTFYPPHALEKVRKRRKETYEELHQKEEALGSKGRLAQVNAMLFRDNPFLLNSHGWIVDVGGKVHIHGDADDLPVIHATLQNEATLWERVRHWFLVKWESRLKFEKQVALDSMHEYQGQHIGQFNHFLRLFTSYVRYAAIVAFWLCVLQITMTIVDKPGSLMHNSKTLQESIGRDPIWLLGP